MDAMTSLPRRQQLGDRWFPQRSLAVYGGGLLALAPTGFGWAARDHRRVDGEALALKPMRFALSIGVYMLTASAMFRYVRPDRRASAPAQASIWMMLVGSTVELSCIGVQAARGRRSHFNRATPGDAIIYAAMGAFAVLFVGGVVPLAWEIARRPDERADRDMVFASVAGLLATFVVGTATGAMMNNRGAHASGPDHKRIPLLGWNWTGGDMRPPHFLGIHAMQALPLIAAGAARLSLRRARSLFVAGVVGYGLLTAGLLRRALRPEPATRPHDRQE